LIKQLLDRERISNRRIGNRQLNCIGQLSVKSDLIHFALGFSNEDVAFIRNQNTNVWKYLNKIKLIFFSLSGMSKSKL
jgi:hypothetical protein